MWEIQVPIKIVPSQIPPLLQNNISPQHQTNATISKIMPLQKVRIPPPNNIPLRKYYILFHVHHLQLIKEQINYLFTALFSPAISTFLTAIKIGYFTTFPNLTKTLVKKYLTKTIISAKGYLVQQYKNSKYTSKIITTPHYFDNPHIYSDLQLIPTKKCMFCYYHQFSQLYSNRTNLN